MTYRATYCHICATPLIHAATGRPRKYCSDRCRQLRRRQDTRWKDRQRWAKRRRAATREIKRIERHHRPIDTTPHPELPLMSLRERIHMRLTRGMQIDFCQWCKRAYLFDDPGATNTHCSPTCRRAEHDSYQRLLRATVTYEGRYDPEVDARLLRGESTVRPCDQCDKPIVIDVPHTRFCSDSCRARHWRETHRPCPHCKRAVPPNPSRPTKRFCSKRCATRHSDGLPYRPEYRAPRPCQRCGEFYTPDRNNGWKQNYCSKECRYNAERKYLDALPSRLCEACGEPCPMNKHSAGTKRYCSERCASRIQMRRRRARQSAR